MARKEIELTKLYYDYVLGNDYQVVIQVGGRFSSKSYNSQIELAGKLASKKDYKVLIIEDIEKEMQKGYYAGLKDKIEQFEHDKAYKFTISPTNIRNTINGNEVLFSGYKSDQQKKSVKSLDQITEILVEEGEWLEYDDFISLIHQLRGKVVEDRKLTILMNPVNEASFVNTEFILKKPDKVFEYFPGTNRPKVFEKHITTEFEYNNEIVKDITRVLIVLSTHHDNPYLTTAQRASIEVLKETDPELYLQLGEARFIKSGGAYFKEFTRDVHVIEPFPIPVEWTRYRSIDYGLDKLAVLWFAVSPNNNVYCYKELHEENLIVSKACNRIKIVNGSDIIRATYNPNDLESRSKDTGTRVTELFKQNGIQLTASSNKRVMGWLSVKEAIKVYEEKDIETNMLHKTSKLKVFDNCETLVSYIQQIKKAEDNPNDCATEPHELTHICDALRYYCVTRFNSFTEQPKEKKATDYDRYVQELTDWS